MMKFLETNKSRIVTVTYIFLFCTFFLFSLLVLQKKMSDYYFSTSKTNGTFKKIYEGEATWLNQRMNNYLRSIIVEQGVAAHVVGKDRERLSRIFDPVFASFGKRYVPVIALFIADTKGNIIYQNPGSAPALQTSHLASPAIRSALASGKPVYGFEAGPLPLHHCVAVPVINDSDGTVVGVIKVATSPAYFHFTYKWIFDDIKTVIIQTKDGSVFIPSDLPLPGEPSPASKDKREQDIEFFKPILNQIDMSSEFSDLRVKDRHFLVSTSSRFLSPEGKEMGRILVAYDMTDVRDRLWSDVYLWGGFFAVSAGLMFLINFVGFYKYERIITNQGKVLAQRSKQCALGEMLGYIGHQWRQPLYTLSVVIQNIELQSQLGQLDDALLKKQVTLANQNIQYISSIIDDWRALLMSGSSRQAIDLRASVERAIAMVAPIMEMNRITIDNQIKTTVMTLGFVNDLVQLTINVLLNARDQLCMKDGERIIQISCREENGSLVTVRFQDNAGGIPKHLLKRIFEPYVTTKDKADGTGLGLYLCRQIAENLDNGKVWAENGPFEFQGTRHVGACICLQFAKTTQRS
ncbi:ATP-binding protein [Geobacter anodireducens]|uniref:histidine kinase n=3 Tax=Geobacter TaxID=28231 RepID=A0A0C1QS97_9BACT|nr:ATP-binding protein [Geobacter soli]ANA41029.1 histidine kinase [Geobacter anodireducens]KIE41121.1 histidine kinase [Geobacter soli]MBE2888153.1 ATP-binding protein [Geobacter anodireducens]